MSRALPRLVWASLLVGLIAAVAAGLGVGVRAADSGWAAVDEPQYLLSALSLWEDGNLDISDELVELRWADFHNPGQLPQQTAPRADGSQYSPHDPLLPVLLAVPMGLGGAVAAKLTLAVLAGVLAAATCWIAVRRLDIPLGIAGPGVASAGASAPLAVYGQQVYPELPAALAVLAAVAALTGRLDRRGLWLLAVAVVALPWLAVKYTPVAAVLAGLGALALLRAGRGRAATGFGAGLAVAGVVYLGLHQLIYDGWTVYAGGDQFLATGEFGVVGVAPDYLGRSVRLLGLLIDRDFGLAAWQPAWLLLGPATFALLVRSGPHRAVLLAPLAAGWLTATYLALTMHGYWWPGRQVVVVLPLAVLVVLRWVTRLPVAARRLGVALAGWGVLVYAVLLMAGLSGRTTWIDAPDRLGLHAPLSWLLPDDRVLSGRDVVLYAAWAVLLAAAAAVAVVAERGRIRRWPGRTSGPPNAATAAADRRSRSASSG